MSLDELDRRQFVKRLVQAASVGAAVAAIDPVIYPTASAAEAKVGLDLLLDEPIGTIKPALYGHFAEHIGGVIYDGIWVGPDSKIPNVDGIRKDVIDHVKRLGKVVVRWPGGCFADKYHWRDGIGPRDKRPRRFGRWREETESNQFGTHEFMRFCRLCDVEPYFAANVGTGSAEEFQQWMEYCNAPAGRTTLADERAANGDNAPLGIRYWGVGNESWGCGGKFTPEDYCVEYRKYTEWLPEFGVPLYLIAAGPNGPDLDWTRRFFKKWADYARAPLHGWALHYYCGTTGHALKFTHDQWYEMLHKANRMETLIQDNWKLMGEHDKNHQVKLVIDEWGAWHPEGTEINKRHLFEQMGCLRDALVAALTLDTFNRHAEKVDMANVAQLVNNLHTLFLADGEKFVATPSFHVFEMYRPHHGAKAVRLDVQSSAVEFHAGGMGQKIFRVAGSASVTGKKATVTLVHSHVDEPAEIALKLHGGNASEVSATVLSHKTLNAHNTFDNPSNVTPHRGEASIKGGEVRIILEPASVTRLDLMLA
ncbi:alpha-N-arabinofuranosidase [Singulisphaera sp. PoT]|uniref:alpha-N-arabinofuranosidase n=1 Tax=Singulisphaera sp. PoT TaxID=3411797 RepID=UPI003BF4EF12